MVEPRGVEALSDDGIADVFKGRVAFRVAWVYSVNSNNLV